LVASPKQIGNKARGQRIERSGVSGLARIEQAFHSRDRAGRTQTQRLIEQ
jgi:hypothetical protein